MLIELRDELKRKNVLLDLHVEYSVNCNDVFVLFLTQEQTMRLYNGKKSAIYDEFNFKKLSYVISGTVEYAGDTHTLTIGYFTSFSQKHLAYVLLNQENKLGEYRFTNVKKQGIDSNRVYLINYKEYKELAEHLGFEQLSFKDYVRKVVTGKIARPNFTLYDVFLQQPEHESRDLITMKGFEIFLDEEEKRTARHRRNQKQS